MLSPFSNLPSRSQYLMKTRIWRWRSIREEISSFTCRRDQLCFIEAKPAVFTPKSSKSPHFQQVLLLPDDPNRSLDIRSSRIRLLMCMCMTYELIKRLCVVYIIIRMCLFSFNKPADSSSRDRLSALRLHAPKLPILVRRGRGLWILIRSCYSRLVTVQLDGALWNINQTTLTFRCFPPMMYNVKKNVMF